jgi:predicted  nucleic acid-binding Zn-ribbon protein
MNELLKQLKELTTVDAAFVQTRDQLARYPAMLAKLEAAEAVQRKAIADAEAELETTQRERRQAEKEISTLDEKIRRVHVQQASVKTNKEYQAINAEIEGLKAKIDTWETAALETLDAEEAIQQRKKTAADQLAALQKEHNVERERIQVQSVEKQERLTRLTSERGRKLAELPDELRETYELLNQKFPGSAVVPLEGATCGGCHWTLVAQTCQAVRNGRELIRCEHCHRFLFMPGA